MDIIPAEHHLTGNCLAEIFGYPLRNTTEEACAARRQYACPFTGKTCSKQSQRLTYPFGVCSVERHGVVGAVCPQRFEEPNPETGNPRVLEDIAQHYFGDPEGVLAFPNMRVPGLGSIDYVLVRHKPLKAEVEDFVAVDFQADAIGGTDVVIQKLEEFMAGQDILTPTYHFGMNTDDALRRAMTQLFNKGILYERWGMRGYWVIQEYVFTTLMRRYGFKPAGYAVDHAARFALYDLTPQDDRLTLHLVRFVSTSVDEVYQAMQQNLDLPDKDAFISTLNAKLKSKLSVKFK